MLISRGSVSAANAAARRLFPHVPWGPDLPAATMFPGASAAKSDRVFAAGTPAVVELQVGDEGEPLPARFLALPLGEGTWAMLTAAAGSGYTEELASQLLAANNELVNQARELSRRTQELELSRTRLEQLGKLREEFLATVSHDLRSPLAAVKLLAARLEGRPERFTAEDAQRLGSRIRGSAVRMERLIENLLSAAQLEEGAVSLHLQPVPLAQVARDVIEVIEPLATQEDRRIVLERGQGQDLALGDEIRLFEVISNLVANALRHTPRGTQVTIIVEGDAKHVRCHIIDRGPGVPQELKTQIFERFRKFGERTGTAGLGLFISRRIIELHGGRIQARDAPAGGAEFVFELAAAR